MRRHLQRRGGRGHRHLRVVLRLGLTPQNRSSGLVGFDPLGFGLGAGRSAAGVGRGAGEARVGADVELGALTTAASLAIGGNGGGSMGSATGSELETGAGSTGGEAFDQNNQKAAMPITATAPTPSASNPRASQSP